MNFNQYRDSWFAIQVKCKQEFVTAMALEQRGYKTCAPFYLTDRQFCGYLKQIKRPLFTGYIFCQYNASASAPIISAPGVIRVVGTRKQALPVLQNEMDAILAMVRTCTRARPHPYMEAGSRVRVTEGALSGVEGILISNGNGTRLVISIELLQRSVATEVSASSVIEIC